MSKKNIEQIIATAKEEIGDEPVIAFVGKTRYGKTVVSTLLYDALFQYFIPKSSGKFTAAVVRGFDTLYQTHKLMMEGKFPPGTLGQRPEVLIEISNTDLVGGKIELMLRDLSGEDNHALLSTERGPPPTEQANAVISYRTSNPNTNGPFAYLLFAKLYVIMVDCSKFHSWRSEDLKFSQIIKTIYDLKTSVNETFNQKMVTPIAILLTKADRLPENIRDLPAKEIVENYTKVLYSALQTYHSGEKEFFKVSVETEQATEEEFELRKKEMMTDLERTIAIEKAELNRQINEEVEKAVQAARLAATQAGNNPQQIEDIAKKAGEEKKIALTSSAPDSKAHEIPSDDELKEKLQKIKMPITYSHGEYIKFISWILRVMPKK